MNIVVGFNSDKEDFGGKISKSLRDAGLPVDDIAVRNLKSSLYDYVFAHKHDVDAVIISEHLESASPYLVKDVENLMAVNEDIRIVLIVDDKHYGDNYMRKLFANGFYSAVFAKDSKMKNIADIILNKRTRRYTKAYYGIAGVPAEESKDMSDNVPAGTATGSPVSIETKETFGKWVDRLSRAATDDERIGIVKSAKKSMAAEVFEDFIDYLPKQIYGAMEHDAELSEYISKIVPQTSPVQYKLSTEVVGVISEAGSDIATFLSVDIAKGCVANGYLPTYFELPYLENEDDNGSNGAYNLLKLGNIEDGFVSHMQAVQVGEGAPLKTNMYEGISMICPNPYTDVLDDWSLLDTYKVLHNATNPVIVSVGKKYSMPDVKEMVRDFTSVVIIVPPSESVAAYVASIKRMLKIGDDKKIVAVVNEPSVKYADLYGYTEVGYPHVFESGYNGMSSDEDRLAVKSILGQLGYLNDADIIPKKKSGFKKMRKPVPTSEIKKIAFFGSQDGAGCTYNTIACASLLAKHYRVAVLDLSDKPSFCCLGDMKHCKVKQSCGYEYFRFSGADYFFQCTYEKFIEMFKNVYDFVLVDCGKNTEGVAFCNADYRIGALVSGVWNCDSLYQFISSMPPVRSGIFYLMSGCNTKELSGYRKTLKLSNIYGMPYSKNPWEPTEDMSVIFSNLLKLGL